MIGVFVDRSAIYSVLDRDEVNHAEATATWTVLLDGVSAGTHTAVTHGGVVIEATALVQRRLGMTATRTLLTAVLPVLEIRWIDEMLHARSAHALMADGSRGVSLVDWTSFVLMHEEALVYAFAYDADFWSRGFTPWRPAV